MEEGYCRFVDNSCRYIRYPYLTTSDVQLDVSIRINRVIIIQPLNKNDIIDFPKSPEAFVEKLGENSAEASALDEEFDKCYVTANLIYNGMEVHTIPLVSHCGKFRKFHVDDFNTSGEKADHQEVLLQPKVTSDASVAEESKAENKNVSNLLKVIGQRVFEVQFDEYLTFPVRLQDLAADSKLLLTMHRMDFSPIGSASYPLFSTSRPYPSQAHARPNQTPSLFQGRVLVQAMTQTFSLPLPDHSFPGILLQSEEELIKIPYQVFAGNSLTHSPVVYQRRHHRDEAWVKPTDTGTETASDWITECREEVSRERFLSSICDLVLPADQSAGLPCKPSATPLVFLFDISTTDFEMPVLFNEKTYEPLLDYKVGKAGLNEFPTCVSDFTNERTGSFDWDRSLNVFNDPAVSKAHFTADLPDMHSSELNPVEVMIQKLTPSSNREDINANLKPNKADLANLERVVNKILSSLLHSEARLGKANREEMDLLWKYQYHLATDKKALLPFLTVVDWNDEFERSQVKRLLRQWENTDIHDALYLLEKFSAGACRQVVVDYAVEILGACKIDDILFFLLPLVQVLRSDIDIEASSTTDQFAGVGSLITFIVGKALESYELASFLIWFIQVEISREVNPEQSVFQTIRKYFYHILSTARTKQSSKTLLALELQQDKTDRIMSLFQVLNKPREKAYIREQNLKQLLTPNGTYQDLLKLPYAVTLPLYPKVKFVGVKPDTPKVIASNTYPIVLDLILKERLKSKKAAAELSHASGTAQTLADLPLLKRVMFKEGDDLRQDQLALQLIGLMDQVLKKANLNMNLTTYRVLATSTSQGMVEFVNNSYPISKVIANFGSIQAFFRNHHPFPHKLTSTDVKKQSTDFDKGVGSMEVELINEAKQDDIDPFVLSRFIRSCAGYCVISYILGIGDRHLDNLMLKPTGEMFHIDFGYLFGRDPKAFATEIRLTKEMIVTMGGRDSYGYQLFKRYCCQTYRVLRRNAGLILTMLSLMRSAGIPDLSLNQSFEVVMLQVKQKFQLDKQDEKAQVFLTRLIDASADALAPVIYDMIHRAAVAIK